MDCACCSSKELSFFKQYSVLNRVTSDSKPWPHGGDLCVCQSCGMVQKPSDDTWKNEISAIYADYAAYESAAGHEQAVFDVNSGQASKRSTQLADFILSYHGESLKNPKILDIGCANGEFLSECNKLFPTSLLYGQDLDRRYENTLSRLSNFQKLYLVDEEPSEKFDLISLIHTLEHIEAPNDLLSSIKNKLNHNTALFIEVPNILANPYDLLIADHKFHFSPKSLTYLLEQAGFEIQILSTSVVSREISVLARPAVSKKCTVTAKEVIQESNIVTDHLTYLDTIKDHAIEMANDTQIGIFGTSNAAAWLYSYCMDKVAFFVDEDPNKIGRTRFDKPIYAPLDVPSDVAICMPLASNIAQIIKKRYPQLQLLNREDMTVVGSL